MICIDQTSHFLVQSKSRNNYIIIMCDYDANAIFSELIPDYKSPTLQKAFLKLFQKINLKGYKLSIIWLDNEIFKEYFALLENLELKVQLVPLYKYHQNLAEFKYAKITL